MPKIKTIRKVFAPPLFYKFITNKEIKNNNDIVYLNVDEYEAIRLADYLGYNHNEAAKQMNVSRPTFTRILASARNKLSDFIINGKTLLIKNDNVEYTKNKWGCCNCNYIWEVFINETPKICPKCKSNNIKNALDCIKKEVI